MKHRRGEEGKRGAEEGAQERVCGDCARGYGQVGVDEVVQRLQEDRHNAGAGEDPGGGGCDPGDGGVGTRPGEPEEADGEEDGADHHGQEALLGDGDVVVGFELAVVARLEVDDDPAAEQDAKDEPDVGQGGDGGVDGAELGEDDGVSFEEEVEDSVESWVSGR